MLALTLFCKTHTWRDWEDQWTDSDRKRVFTVWRPGVFSRSGFHKQNQYTLSVRIWPSHTSPQCRWAVCHDRQGSSEDSEITRGNFKHLPSVTFLTILRIPFIHSLPAITYLGIQTILFLCFSHSTRVSFLLYVGLLTTPWPMHYWKFIEE